MQRANTHIQINVEKKSLKAQWNTHTHTHTHTHTQKNVRTHMHTHNANKEHTHTHRQDTIFNWTIPPTEGQQSLFWLTMNSRLSKLIQRVGKAKIKDYSQAVWYYWSEACTDVTETESDAYCECKHSQDYGADDIISTHVYLVLWDQSATKSLHDDVQTPNTGLCYHISTRV